MCKHWECVCYNPRTETCDYILIFGERRGCPPTEDCAKYRTNFDDVKGFLSPLKRREVDLGMVDRMRRVYNSGITIEKMAEKAKVPSSTMLSWVRKAHPENPNLDRYELKW